MENLSGKFLDEYKRLDKLCKDTLNCETGVTAYIEQMDSISFEQQAYSSNFNEVYKKLKNLRWKRNRLAHDVDIDDDLILQEDVDYVIWFHSQITSLIDPLAVIYKKQQEQERKQKLEQKRKLAEQKRLKEQQLEEQKQRQQQLREQPLEENSRLEQKRRWQAKSEEYEQTYFSSTADPQPKKKSFFSKLKDKIKNFFEN